MLVAIQAVPGASTRNGMTRRATSGPATQRIVVATATTADVPTAITNAADHPGPRRPTCSRVQSTSTGSGGCPFTWVGYRWRWVTNPRTNCAGFPTEGSAARYSVVLVRGDATARQPLDAASSTAHPAAHAQAQPSSDRHGNLRVSGVAATMAIPTAAAGHNGQIWIRCRRWPKNGAAVPSCRCCLAGACAPRCTAV